MVNKCTNIAVISGAEKPVLDRVLQEITENFECYTDIETESGSYELEFTSDGPFPQMMMEKITAKYIDKHLYIQVVTYELPHELVQHHIYENGKWTDKLAGKHHHSNKYNTI